MGEERGRCRWDDPVTGFRKAKSRVVDPFFSFCPFSEVGLRGLQVINFGGVIKFSCWLFWNFCACFALESEGRDEKWPDRGLI